MTNHETTNTLNTKQKKYLYLFLFVIFFIYFISSSYITCSNDGSHFALTSSIVENNTIKINKHILYTTLMDYAKKDNSYYSDRVPGTAFLGTPFYALGKMADKFNINNILSDYTNIKEVFIIFLPNLMGVLVLYFLFKLFILFGFNFKESLLSTFIFSLGTPAYFQSTHFFSHIISMAFVLISVYLAIKIKKVDTSNTKYLIFISILLALASIVEIQNILFVFAFFVYFVISKKIDLKKIFYKKNIKLLSLLTLIFIIIYSSLIIYNYSAFGEFTIKSNKYNPNFPEEKQFITSLSGNPLVGLDRLSINSLNSEVIFNWSKGVRNDTPGLFVLAPIFFISLLGFYYFIKKHKYEALFFLLLIFIEVFVVAFHKTVLTRHISTILPFCFFPIIFIVQKSFKKYWLLFLISVLFLASYARIFYTMNSYWGRSLEYPFTFLHELPSFFIFCFISYTLFLIFKKFNQHFNNHNLKS